MEGARRVAVLVSRGAVEAARRGVVGWTRSRQGCLRSTGAPVAITAEAKARTALRCGGSSQRQIPTLWHRKGP